MLFETPQGGAALGRVSQVSSSSILPRVADEASLTCCHPVAWFRVAWAAMPPSAARASHAQPAGPVTHPALPLPISLHIADHGE